MNKYVLFSTLFVQSSFLFSQTANTWIQKTSLPGSARFGAVAFVIGDKAYVGTGQDNAGNLLKDFGSTMQQRIHGCALQTYPAVEEGMLALFRQVEKGL